MKKSYMLLSALIVAGNLGAEGLKDLKPAVKLLGALGVGVGVKLGGNVASGNNTLRKIGDAVGVNTRDAATAGAVLSVLGTYAAVQSGEDQKIAKACAVHFGRALAGLTVVSNKHVNGLVKSVPYVGGLVSCDNPVCEGVCNDCVLTKGAAGFGVTYALHLVAAQLTKE